MMVWVCSYCYAEYLSCSLLTIHKVTTDFMFPATPTMVILEILESLNWDVFVAF